MITPKIYGGHWYTPEKIANARKNIEKYDWAKQKKNRVVENAEKCLAKGAEFYWSAIASNTIPRTIHANFQSECPICGKEMTQKYGSYSWVCHTENNAWEIECPNCHIILPSNDFKSYYESGLDEKGIFRSSLADPKYLVNTKYPDKGEGWLVDDGFGWTADNGDMWSFVGYYHHYGLWFKAGRQIGTALILNAIENLTEAFIYTGDMRYADLGLVILDRMADVYPDMHLGDFKDWKPYYNSDGGRKKGKISGTIWEHAIVETALKAIDAFIPVLHRSNAVEILNAIYKKRGLSLQKESNAALSDHLYNNLVRQVYEGVKNVEICGNTGMHHSALALAAVVAGKSDEADEWVDWIFRTDVHDWYRDGISSGGNISALLIDRVSRDGFGDEASPSYNSIWLVCLLKVAEILRMYPGINPQNDLINLPRFKKMAYSYIPIPINGEYLPGIGDTGACGNPGAKGVADWLAGVYRYYKDPDMAYMAWMINGKTAKGLFNDIFEEDPEKPEKEMKEAARQCTDRNLYGTSLPAYGYSTLCMNEDNVDYNERPFLYMYYGSNSGHGHYDTLNIGYYQHRLNLMPDLGYPEFATTYPRRSEWTHNVISHNTVAVDKDQTGHQTGGWLTGYASGEKAGYMKASGLPAYPNLERYDRSCALISCGKNKSYIIDRFTVAGGLNHYYSLHGSAGNTEVINNRITLQEKGSYAGENVEYGFAPGIDYTKPYRGFDGIGLHYLKNVRHIMPENKPVRVQWNIRDHWNVHQGQAPDVKLNMRILSDVDKLDLATGIPPRNKPGTIKELDYLIAYRNADRSEFVSCISASVNNDFIDRVERLEAVPLTSGDFARDVCAVKVTLADNTIDYILFSDSEDSAYMLDDRYVLSGSFTMIRIQNRKITYAITDGGTKAGDKTGLVIDEPFGVVRGVVSDFTREMTDHCQIVLNTDVSGIPVMDNDLFHRFVFIEHDDRRISAFRIFGYEYKQQKLFLDIGNQSPIIGLQDPRVTDKNFLYEIENGMEARIALLYRYSNQ